MAFHRVLTALSRSQFYGATFVTSILLLTEANFVQQKSLLSNKSHFCLTKVILSTTENEILHLDRALEMLQLVYSIMPAICHRRTTLRQNYFDTEVILSRQNDFCRDKITFVEQKYFCRDKICFCQLK